MAFERVCVNPVVVLLYSGCNVFSGSNLLEDVCLLSYGSREGVSSVRLGLQLVGLVCLAGERSSFWREGSWKEDEKFYFLPEGMRV
jgi:hypothetical protein